MSGVNNVCTAKLHHLANSPSPPGDERPAAAEEQATCSRAVDGIRIIASAQDTFWSFPSGDNWTLQEKVDFHRPLSHQIISVSHSPLGDDQATGSRIGPAQTHSGRPCPGATGRRNKAPKQSLFNRSNNEICWTSKRR